MKGYLKKALAMTMAGVMVCGILTGCGSKTTETKAETTAETGAESAAGEASAEVKTVEDGVLKVAMHHTTGHSQRMQTVQFRFPEAPITPMDMML